LRVECRSAFGDNAGTATVSRAEPAKMDLLGWAALCGQRMNTGSVINGKIGFFRMSLDDCLMEIKFIAR
jgi:hypothetical protein